MSVALYFIYVLGCFCVGIFVGNISSFFETAKDNPGSLVNGAAVMIVVIAVAFICYKCIGISVADQMGSVEEIIQSIEYVK